MRILISVHHPMASKFSPAGVTLLLANALRERGHSVDILSYDSMGTLRGKSQLLVYPFFVAWFVFKHRRYDVLDLSSGDGWVLSLIPRGYLGTPSPLVVARSHCLEHVAHETHLELSRLGLKKLSWKYPIYHGGLRLWECRRCFAHADLALLLNDVERRYAIDHLGVSSNRAVIVKNGIADRFIKRARSLLLRPEDSYPRSIAFIGRYTELKGSRYLSSAMRNILTANPQATLGLFGAMKDPSDVLADYPSELRHRISVVPAYDNEDLVELMRGYHILAFPSIVEAFGIAPLEAMACGLVPVVADTPGPTSYIENGRNGVTVPVKDACALEQAIGDLLKDPDRWNHLRRAALRTALEYSYDEIASELEMIYAMSAGGRSKLG